MVAGADFFTTEVWTWHGLVTHYTVFVIDLASRCVQILGSVSGIIKDSATTSSTARRLSVWWNITGHQLDSPCHWKTLLAFVAKGSVEGLDVSCAAAIRRPLFATEIPAEFALQH